jgi:hypothetical protein
VIRLSWQHYAEWLVSINGMDLEDAIDKSIKLYQKQHQKVVKEEDLKKFHEDRVKYREF